MTDFYVNVYFRDRNGRREWAAEGVCTTLAEALCDIADYEHAWTRSGYQYHGTLTPDGLQDLEMLAQETEREADADALACRRDATLSLRQLVWGAI